MCNKEFYYYYYLFICNSLVASELLIDMLFALRASVLFFFSFDLILIDLLPI